MLACIASPAAAQLAGSFTIASDYRYRGYSLTGRNPALTANLSYDDASGLYLAASGTAVIDDGPAIAAGQANIGYARRLKPGLSIEAGLLGSHFGARAPAGRAVQHAEAYVGLTWQPLSVRVFYAPDYLETGSATVYAELDAVVQPAEKWRVNGHLGALDYRTRPYAYASGAIQHDWRVTVARELGAIELRAAVSGAGPGLDPYSHGRRTAVVFAASWAY